MQSAKTESRVAASTMVRIRIAPKRVSHPRPSSLRHHHRRRGPCVCMMHAMRTPTAAPTRDVLAAKERRATLASSSILASRTCRVDAIASACAEPKAWRTAVSTEIAGQRPTAPAVSTARWVSRAGTATLQKTRAAPTRTARRRAMSARACTSGTFTIGPVGSFLPNRPDDHPTGNVRSSGARSQAQPTEHAEMIGPRKGDSIAALDLPGRARLDEDVV